ncbi:hypothetical protein ACUXZZ_24030 [Streptomyces graminifolii]|uniref:hypothetical protein n=1 Tax=Streptomyces graminifolii TaxID=1266771 RepID=UPI00405944E9
MPEPVTTTAASAAAKGASQALARAAAKQVLSRSGTKLGDRHERRQVYARFMDAMIEGVAHVQYLRFIAQQVYPWRMRARTAAELADMNRKVLAELLQAYMDLRLAGNPPVLEKGDELLTALNGAFDVVRAPDAKYDEATEQVGAAQRAFVDACRDDLGYLPKPWQVWRLAWWGVRWRNWRRRRGLPQGT